MGVELLLPHCVNHFKRMSVCDRWGNTFILYTHYYTQNSFPVVSCYKLHIPVGKHCSGGFLCNDISMGWNNDGVACSIFKCQTCLLVSWPLGAVSSCLQLSLNTTLPGPRRPLWDPAGQRSNPYPSQKGIGVCLPLIGPCNVHGDKSI